MSELRGSEVQMNTAMFAEVLNQYGSPIFSYEPTKEEIEESKAIHGDIASEYHVFADKDAIGGIIVYARYGKRIIANPWSTRYLIAHLIRNQSHVNLV